MTQNGMIYMARQIDWMIKNQKSPSLICRKISIGMTPETYHECEAIYASRGLVFNRDVQAPTQLCGYPIKIIEQLNGEGARGAWAMIELDPEGIK